MKPTIQALIVVEGVTDVQVLSAIVDAEFLTTNGSAVSQETIEFIRYVKSLGKEVVVFTDPDYPGEKIRKTLDQQVQGLSHAFVDKSFAIKNGKVGIAECDSAVLLQALQDKIVPHIKAKPSITIHDLANMNLLGNAGSSEKRTKICKHFHLGYCNAKTMLKRLNFIGITYDDLKEVAK
jgi:ribonuclease M5